jgi:hypothetical protein
MSLAPEERAPLHEADDDGDEEEGERFRQKGRPFLNPGLPHQAEREEAKQEQRPQDVARQRHMKPRCAPLPCAKDQGEDPDLKNQSAQQ